MSARNGNGVGITRSTQADALPEWLSVPEVAAWLGISKNCAYDLVRRGEIKAIRLGRLVRVAKSTLAELAQ